MSAPAPSVTGSESRLVKVLDDYLAALHRGGQPDKTALLAANPELAEDLEVCLASLDFIRHAASSSPVDVEGGETLDGDCATGLLGDFRIIREAGRGGMGVVYEAEQLSLGRRVAIKVLPFAAALDPRQLARFRVEAQAAAQLHHTNIVPVFSVGVERGVHYYAMQFIEGQSLADLIREMRQAGDLGPTRSSPQDQTPVAGTPGTSALGRPFFQAMARLGIQAAEALEYAHSLGIVHRDIKPANLLLDVRGTLWVTDFGLARLNDDAGLTMTGDVLGTLRYMSPEQALAHRVLIDERTDVYSLGVTLYELLTLRPAFDGRDRRELLRQIAFEEPPPPRRIDPAIPRELETVVLRAIGKEPGNRYASSQDLADDLRRFLEHRPIKARRPTLVQRTVKWSRRHRVAVASAVVALLLATVGLSVSIILITRERAETVRQQDLGHHHRYVSDIRQADQFVQSGQGRKALELLRNWRPAPGEHDFRNFAWYYLLRLCHDERRTLRGHTGDVYHAEYSPDGRTVVSCGKDGSVRFWDVATGQPLRTISIQAAGDVNWADFSSDGRILATASDDGTVRLWNAATCASQAVIPAHKGVAVYVRFVSDGRLVSAGRNDGVIKLWDLGTRREIASARANEGLLENVAFSPDGKTLATAEGDGRPRLWNVANLSSIPSDLQHGSTAFGIAFSSDGSRLVTGDVDHRVRTWELPGGKERNEFRGFQHSADVQSVAFLAGDRMIVSGGDHGILRLWDAATGTGLGTLMGHTEKIWGVSVSPDGKSLATASADGTVKLWDAQPPRQELVIPSPGPGATKFSFTSDGRSLIFARSVGRSLLRETDGTPFYYLEDEVEVYGIDPRTGAKQFHHTLEKGRQVHPYLPWLTPDGAVAIFHFKDATVTTWEVATGKRLATLDDVLYMGKAYQQFVLVYRRTGPSELVDASTGQSRHLFPRTESSDVLGCTRAGDVFALRDHDELILWDMAANQARCRRLGDHTAAIGATFSPDSTILATIDRNLAIHLWDARNLALLGTPLIGHSEGIRSLGFSPDGKTLLSASNDGTIRLWDVMACEELLTLRKLPHVIDSAQFSPDGRMIAFDSDGFRVLSTRLPEDLHSEEEP